MSKSRVKEHESFFEWFIHSEVLGSIVLIVCAVLALMLANSPLADSYFALAKTYIGIFWGEHSFKLSLEHWIKDGLMAIFFFVVGLEIKRELTVGELSTVRKAILPVGAALGGAIVPAAIYLAFHLGEPAARGWAIPMATDIAFALGILALFGSRAPIGLKVFLTALAIADDMLAVSVIALFYTEQIDLAALGLSLVFLALIVVANRLGVRQTWIYLVLAFGVWVDILLSGVHATVAGVLLALAIPVKGTVAPIEFFRFSRDRLEELERMQPTAESIVLDPKQRKAVESVYLAADETLPPGLVLEHKLHPFQAFVIVPLFALFSAGIPLAAGGEAGAATSIAFAVALALVLGKQIGVMLFGWLIVRGGFAALPEGVTWTQIWGVSALAGIGFTMSIFIAELAFSDPGIVNQAKIGIFAGSLVSAVCGYLILSRALPREDVGAG